MNFDLWTCKLCVKWVSVLISHRPKFLRQPPQTLNGRFASLGQKRNQDSGLEHQWLTCFPFSMQGKQRYLKRKTNSLNQIAIENDQSIREIKKNKKNEQ